MGDTRIRSQDGSAEWNSIAAIGLQWTDFEIGTYQHIKNHQHPY